MLLTEFQRKKRTAFIPYVVAGDPTLKDTEKVVEVLVSEGADVLELGVPFTDAMADGPVIQNASEKAAQRNGSMGAVLELAQTLKKKHPKLGIVIFSYYNPIFKMTAEKFAEKAKRAGVDAVLTVDLPPEEADLYSATMKERGVGTVFLASPTTSQERLKLIEKASTEFVYYISRTGVTGVQARLSETLEKDLKILKESISKPIAVGFGISNGSQAAQVAPLVDGVVVGSAFVKLINSELDLDSALAKVRSLAKEINLAVRGASSL